MKLGEQMSRKFIFVWVCWTLALSSLSAWAQERAVLDKYCVTCHNQKLKTAGLALDGADFVRPSNSADAWEKVIRKLRAEMMPPVGAPRPDKAALDSVASYLESSIDKVAAANPNPGRSTAIRESRPSCGWRRVSKKEFSSVRGFASAIPS